MRKTILLSIACGILLSGCAGISFETKRFVKNNTFYSSQFPKLTITVNDNLEYASKKSSRDDGENTGKTKYTSIETAWYYFQNRAMKRELNISLESLHEQNWYMVAPDYSKEKYPITSGKETLNGVGFYTGIFVVPKDNYSMLIKAYGKSSGDRVRFQIFYIEYVGNEWLTEPVFYSSQQRDYLSAFKRRAGESFTVSDYVEQVVPAISQSVPVVAREEQVLTTKERFQNIQDLYKSGLMTEEEYQAKRKEIMSEL